MNNYVNNSRNEQLLYVIDEEKAENKDKKLFMLLIL